MVVVFKLHEEITFIKLFWSTTYYFRSYFAIYRLEYDIFAYTLDASISMFYSVKCENISLLS